MRGQKSVVEFIIWVKDQKKFVFYLSPYYNSWDNGVFYKVRLNLSVYVPQIKFRFNHFYDMDLCSLTYPIFFAVDLDKSNIATYRS